MVSLNANDDMVGDLHSYGIDYEVPCEDSSDDAIVLPQNQFHLTDEEKAELFSDIDPLTADFFYIYLKFHTPLTKSSTGTLITIQYSFYSYITLLTTLIQMPHYLQNTATLLKDIYYIYCIKKEKLSKVKVK